MSTERWKDVDGYPGYRVSNAGDVLTMKQKRNRLLRPGVQSKGFRTVLLYDGSSPKRPVSHNVSRLVADAFLRPPRDGQTEVVHLDGDKQNDAATNLRRMTPVEARQYQIAHGIVNLNGEDNVRAKLTEADVKAVRKSDETYPILSKRYGVCVEHIGQIRRHESWSHVK